MVRHTILGEDDGAALARAFGVGNAVALESIDAGTINSNYRLDTDRGRYFLRVNEGKREEDVRYEFDLVAALSAGGVAIAAPMAAADGTPFVRHRDRFISLFPWVDGAHDSPRSLSASRAGEVGRALAALHRVGEPLAERFERAGIYTTEAMITRFESFRDSADPELVSAIALLAEEIDELNDRAEERRAAPHGIIHGDLFPDNVLFDDRGAAILLDFEQASTGAWVYDLAVLVNAWCYLDEFDWQLVTAMIRGYDGERSLSQAEWQLLPVELRAAAMRFTVTRITDIYLPGLGLAGKDFRRYRDRLAAWRTDRARAKLRALQSG